MNVYNLANAERDVTRHQTCEHKHDVYLINGNFQVSDAQQRLMRVLNDNLAYHALRNFSSEERLGCADTDSEQKIKDLNNFKEELLALVKIAKEKGLKLDVQAQISISLS